MKRAKNKLPGLLIGALDGGASGCLERRVMRLLETPWARRWRMVSAVGCVGACMVLSAGVVMAGVRPFHFAWEAQLLHATGPLPRFEVATIKPGADDGGQMTDVKGAVIVMHNFSVKDLLQMAYGIRSDNQLDGVQGWMTAKRFDIEAKLSEEEVAAEQKLQMQQKVERWSLMMQALLAERFQLKTSETSREAQVYELVLAKGGAKLKASTVVPGTRSPLQGRPGKIEAAGVPMSTLTGTLGRLPELGGGGFLSGGGMVVDKTGLTGVYDWTLIWLPANAEPGTAGVNPDAPGLFTALDEELGLRLVKAKMPVQVLVVEHVELPTEN